MKTELQIKQLALLEETAKTYNSDNRCINDEGICKYFVEGKIGCAIGRLIEDKELCKRLDDSKGKVVKNIKIFNQLPEKLKEYTQEFLSDLQILHDNSDNWNEEGLSETGKKVVSQIIRAHKLV
jgi:hypothetical protein